MKQGHALESSVRFFNLTLTTLACLGLAALTAWPATTRYVWPNSPNPTPPFTDWTTAARVIQDAVDAAQAGDLVLVTNGTYATGGRAAGTNLLANRVAVEKPLRLESVNGPAVTIIQGAKAPGGGNGDGAVRCAYLADGVTLSGFTLTGGATRSPNWFQGWHREAGGGGALCASASAVLTNCVLIGNSARDSGGGATGGTLDNCTLTGNSAGAGGGASGGTLNNCVLTGNSADWGGGASGGTLSNCVLTGNTTDYVGGGASHSTLYNCTVTGNSAGYGGGAFESTLYNCTLTGNSAAYQAGGVFRGQLFNSIVYFNQAPSNPNWFPGNDTQVENSCTTPLPPGLGNLASDPQLVSLTRLATTSPCIGAGSAAYAGGVDLDGEPWANPPAMGADQPAPPVGPLTVLIIADFTKLATGASVEFTAQITGSVLRSVWNLGDGVVMTNQPFARRSWNTPGVYPIQLTAYNDTHAEGVTATLEVTVIEPTISYVDVAGTNPVFPYASWATAATNIQDAIGSAPLPGHLVLVTNGLYRTGTVEGGNGPSRVALTNRVVVRSVNGPEVTVIEGSRDTGEDIRVRCAYVGDGSVMSGFTLTKGSGTGSWVEPAQSFGGGRRSLPRVRGAHQLRADRQLGW